MSGTTEPEASFAEIRGLIAELPGPDLEAGTSAAQRAAAQGAKGRDQELCAWLAAWQGKSRPRLDHPRICLFAGNHGVVAHAGVRGVPAASLVRAIVDGTAEINRLSEAVDADLRVYEMALDRPTRAFTREPAMSEEECARAVAYGMMAVEPGLDLLCVGAIGDGSSTAAAALSLLSFGGTARDWADPEDTETVADGARHAAADPLLVLRCVGGHELAAIAGAVLAARLARIPVVLDGFAATAAASIAWKLDRRGLDHCQVAAAGGDRHRQLTARLGKTPLIEGELIRDIGAGAVLALQILRDAVPAD